MAVSVGHVQELKGFHRLLDVWPAVLARLETNTSPPPQLVLVGSSAGEPRYERAVEREVARLRPQVIATGPLPPEAVARLLNRADIFVLASRSEGWCNALAEALACGCPAVATDVGGNREIIRSPNLGRLVPPDDRDALIDAIEDAMNHSWDRAAIAREGGRRTWAHVATECVAMFESLGIRAAAEHERASAFVSRPSRGGAMAAGATGVA